MRELMNSACIKVACDIHTSTYIFLVQGRDVA